jgi:plastocyanin
MKELRDRVLRPLSIPLVAVAVIVFVVLNMSRILLALEERSSATVTTAVAIVIAASILFGCAYISARGETRSGANLSVLASAGVVLLVAGFIGFEALQETHDQELAKAKEQAGAVGPADVSIHAFDIGFRQKTATTHSGKNRIEEVNDGATRHTLLFDEVPGFLLEVPSGGSHASKEVDLKPGTYTYYCDVPGHRSAGMEGKLTVTEGGGGSAAGGAGVNITAGDLFFNPKEVSASPGPVNISITNEGAILHTLVVEEDPKFKKLEVPTKGAKASGTLDAKPGTYTLYCDQPGHRAAGMETKLKIG